MRNAIVCLTKGYNDLDHYNSLVYRNRQIHKFFGTKYPNLIFNEGNIPVEHQNYIDGQSGFESVFVDVSSTFAGGYEGMCRFMIYDIWEWCVNYDNIMRIDEDCFITKMERDPFEHMGNRDYLRSAYWEESHEATNATLPGFIQKLTGSDPKDFYKRFVYTNVFLGKVSFWRDPVMNDILKEIAFSDLQRKNRWGDLPVIGSLLNLFGKVGFLEGLEYYHASHGILLNCDGKDDFDGVDWLKFQREHRPK